jgi:hypothetical protein
MEKMPRSITSFLTPKGKKVTTIRFLHPWLELLALDELLSFKKELESVETEDLQIETSSTFVLNTILLCVPLTYRRLRIRHAITVGFPEISTTLAMILKEDKLEGFSLECTEPFTPMIMGISFLDIVKDLNNLKYLKLSHMDLGLTRRDVYSKLSNCKSVRYLHVSTFTSMIDIYLTDVKEKEYLSFIMNYTGGFLEINGEEFHPSVVDQLVDYALNNPQRIRISCIANQLYAKYLLGQTQLPVDLCSHIFSFV